MSDMTLTEPVSMQADFRVGPVLNRALTILSRNFGPFFVLSAAAAIPGLVISALVLTQLGSGGPQRLSPPLLVTNLVLTFVLYVVCQSVTLYSAFQIMRGEPINIGASIKIGLARFWPVLGVALLTGIAYVVGFLLLIVPAFIFLAMFFVALPVCVVERAGPRQSMRRSRELTKGFRWKLFGLMVLLAVISIIGGIVVGLVGHILGAAGNLIVTFVWQTIVAAYNALIIAVAYHDLRVSKEGIDIHRIVAVFA